MDFVCLGVQRGYNLPGLDGSSWRLSAAAFHGKGGFTVIIIFNIVGAVMVIVSVALACGVSLLIGSQADGPIMILVGSVCIFFDVSYRIRQPSGHWLSPFGGGHIIFLPVWLIGSISMVAGIVKLFTRPEPIGLLGIAIVTLLVVAALGLTALQLIHLQIGGIAPTGAPRPKNGVIRCPQCNMPTESEKLMDGSCPWCGASVE